MRVLKSAALAAILLAPATSALAQNADAAMGFQPYATLGYSHLHESDADLDIGSITGRFGAKITPYFGAEVEGAFGVLGTEYRLGAAEVEVHLNYEVAGYAVGFLPLNDQFELFARVGYGTQELKFKSGGVSETDSEESVNFGGGLSYFWSPTMGVRGGYTRHEFDGGGGTNVFDIAAVFRF